MASRCVIVLLMSYEMMVLLITRDCQLFAQHLWLNTLHEDKFDAVGVMYQ